MRTVDRAPPAFMDVQDAAPRVSFSNPITLPSGSNMERTDEGYLLCRNVPLARTGQQIYMGYEVPLEPGPDGTVVVDREAEHVFRPETIASFAGKPFTDNHPNENLSPANWRNHMVGVVQNPRQGTGDKSHLLLGDILVYDEKTINSILAGKREVSCGYDADYARVEPGRGRQVNIRGNHVSLVTRGRCGADCAIMDGESDMSKKWDRASFMDRVRLAFKTKDEDELEKQLDDIPVDIAGEPEDAEDGDGRDLDQHIRINIEHSGDGTRDDGVTTPAGGDPDLAGIVTQAVQAALAPVLERMAAIESKVGEHSETMDSLGVHIDPNNETARDLAARAEVLAPGIQLPVLDAAPGSRSRRVAEVSLMRTALTTALANPATAAAVTSVGGPRPVLDKMPDQAIEVMFRAASEKVAMQNAARQRVVTTPVPTRDGQPIRRVQTSADINEVHRRYYGRPAA